MLIFPLAYLIEHFASLVAHHSSQFNGIPLKTRCFCGVKEGNVMGEKLCRILKQARGEGEGRRKIVELRVVRQDK